MNNFLIYVFTLYVNWNIFNWYIPLLFQNILRGFLIFNFVVIPKYRLSTCVKNSNIFQELEAVGVYQY